METIGHNSEASFLDLPWEDVVNTQILPKLSWQDLFRLRLVSNECHRLIKGYFSKCHHIDLSKGCNRITALAFQIITCSNSLLTTLILSNCKWLTDSLLSPVLELNPCLVCVDVSGCQSISAVSLQILATRCRQIQKLSLKDCHWQTAAALTVIAYHCPQLYFIDLTSCWQVNDEAVCALVESCPRLTHISLAKIYGITNSSLFAISYHCRSLTHLDLVGCWRITDEGVRMVGEYCKDLKTLLVCECRDVSEASLQSLRSRVSIDLPSVPYPYNRAIFLKELGLNVQI